MVLRVNRCEVHTEYILMISLTSYLLALHNGPLASRWGVTLEALSSKQSKQCIERSPITKDLPTPTCSASK